MKLSTIYGLHLGTQGASHLVLPLAIVVLLAVGGTFMMVAKNVSNAQLADININKAAKASNMGMLVITSPNAQWNAAKIHPVNASSAIPKCITDGLVKSSGGGYIVRLTKDKSGNFLPHNIKCTAVGGSEAYHIFYGRLLDGDKFEELPNSEFISVDVDKNLCTIVQPEEPVSKSAVIKVAPVKDSCPIEQ